VVPAGATSVSLVASSFAKAGVKVDGVPGSLRTVALQAGGGAVLRATLHDQATGAQLAEYTVTLKRSEEADGGELVRGSALAPPRQSLSRPTPAGEDRPRRARRRPLPRPQPRWRALHARSRRCAACGGARARARRRGLH